jgi:hypothetical protein
MTFELVDAKLWHCGQMARMARDGHAVTMMGISQHHELRLAFQQSPYKKSWLIDGKLAAIGGVIGPTIAAHGIIWLTFSNLVSRYPVAATKLMRKELAEIMVVKRLLYCTIIDGDQASERFATFLGFVPASKERELSTPALSRHGRREIIRELTEDEHLLVPTGKGFVRMMAYRDVEAA